VPISRPNLNLALPSIHVSNAQESHASVDELRKQSGARWLHDSPYLYFMGNDAATFRQFETALKRIESTSTGQILINCIDDAARRKQERLDIVLNSTRLGVIANNSADAENGRGTGSELHCNFKEAEWMGGSGSAEDKIDFTASLLFHELVHVFHNFTGERVRVTPSDKEISNWPELLHEEARTVGLGTFSDEELSENAFRAEIGLPARKSYSHDSATILNDDTAMVGFQRHRLFP